MSFRTTLTLMTALLGVAAFNARTSMASETVIKPTVLTRVVGAPAPTASSVPVTTVGWRYRAAYGYPYYAARPYVAYRPYVYANPYPYYGGVAVPYGAYYRGPAVYGRYPGRYHW